MPPQHKAGPEDDVTDQNHPKQDYLELGDGFSGCLHDVANGKRNPSWTRSKNPRPVSNLKTKRQLILTPETRPLMRLASQVSATLLRVSRRGSPVKSLGQKP